MKEEAEKILHKAEVLTMAINDEKYPYIVPVNFGYIWKDGQLTLFFHGSKKSRKNTLIAKNPYVSFQCDCARRLMLSQSESACRTDFAYGSLMGCGKIEPLDGKEKAEALYCILEKYKVPQRVFDEKTLENTAVYKIIAEKYTTKTNHMEE